MYAVIDVETTGLWPGGHDRVIEVAVVQVDASGRTLDRWCTLVNPGRDLGPQEIHGIRSAEVLDAPDFAQIAGRLGRLLAGRTVVAHNLSFDARFLLAEYERVGARVPLEPGLGLCTMRLAGHFLPYAGRALTACCDAAGITLTNAHSALHDAQGVADLLAFYLARAGQPPPWAQVCAAAARAPWPDLPVREVAPVLRQAPGAVADHFLRRLVARLPRVGDEQADTYLDLLDRALLDLQISVTEARALVECASSVGLGREQVGELHLRYLAALAAVALSDAVVTAEEREDLVRVAALLDLDEHHVDQALKRAEQEGSAMPALGRFHLHPGDRIVFTGQLSEPREVWEARARAAGLEPGRSVTKQTRLVVAADPDTQSGKARQAREGGIPIADPPTFLRLCRQLPDVGD